MQHPITSGSVVYEDGRRGWAEDFRFVGQPEAPKPLAPTKLDPAKIAKAKADCDTVAKLMGWS